MSADRKLFIGGIAVLVYNAIAAAVAVAANWPTQFGKVGTDAGADVITVGTAISAPILPVVTLVAGLVLIRREGRARTAGLALTGLTGVMVGIGAIGEFAAAATPDTPRAVLIYGAVSFLTLAATLITLTIGAWRSQRTASKQTGTIAPTA